MTEKSLFTKIILGEIPSYKVYEDEKTLAFLTIHPSQPGHTLVVPKNQEQFIWDLNEEDYTSLFKSVKKVGSRIKQVTGKPYVGVKVIGEAVPHAHVHLIPFSTAQEYNLAADEDGPVDHEALKAMSERLRF